MTSTTLNKLSHMKLLGMLRSYQSMLTNRMHDDLTHDEVIDTLVQSEWEDRENKKINRHLRRKKRKYSHHWCHRCWKKLSLLSLRAPVLPVGIPNTIL